MSHRAKIRSRSTLTLVLLAVVLVVAALAVAAPALADQQPVVWVTPVTVTEGDTGVTNAAFTVHRTHGSANRTVVTYRTGNGSATTPSDYTETVGQVVMAPGFDEATVRVPVVGDTRPESDETLYMMIASPSGARVSDSDAIATILDDDRLPGVSIGDSTVVEGDTGTVDAVFPVSLDRPSAVPVRVRYATSNFGSAKAPSDFVATSGTLTIPAGNTSATITVKVNGDTIAETGVSIDRGVGESFYVGLSDPVNATVLDTTTLFGGGFGRIVDDDKMPYLRVLDDAVVEGGTEVFKVQLSGPAKNPVTAFYDTSTSDSSVPARSGVLTFAPGETSKSVSIPTSGDCVVQGNRAISFDLSDVTGATLQDGHAFGWIYDDDQQETPPACSTRPATGMVMVAPASVVETDSGTVLRFTVYGKAGASGSVSYQTREFGATAGADFTPVSGTVSAGGTTVVNVPVVGDDIQENDEYLYLDINRVSGSAFDTTVSNQGFIIDDDVAPLISVSDASVVEGDAGTTSDVAVEMSLAAPSLAPSAVRWDTRSGSADASTDYTAASGTVTFQPGETTKVIHLSVNGDAVDEADERFTIFVYDDATNAVRSDNTGVVVILDDDRTPTVSLDSPSFPEGTTGTAPAHFTVSLSQPSALPVTVDYATGNDTAVAPDDYVPTSGTLTFAPGETSKDVAVTLQSDTVAEGTEYFDLRLTSPSNAVLEENRGTLFGYLYVLDDDVVPVITAGEVSAVETDSGTSPMLFTVGLSQGSANTVTVNYATSDGGATAPGDYTASTGTVTFAPGETAKTVSVPVVGDTIAESDENFRLNLSAPVNAFLRDPYTSGTVRDNDAQPNLALGDSGVVEGNSGTKNSTFTVTLQPASVNTVTVAYATFDGSARAGEDYVATSGTLSFAPGQTSKTVTVRVNGDTAGEGDESFGLDLSAPVNANLWDGRGFMTIFDDDRGGTTGGAVVTVDDSTVLEPDTGSTDAAVTVRVAPAAAGTVQVRYRVVSYTATAGEDFTPQTGILTFAAGQTSARITVPVLGDIADENDERAIVQLFGLSGPPNTRYGDTDADFVVLDNDRSPLVSIDDLAVDEGGAGNTVDAAMTVRLHQPSAVPVSVDWQTTNGNATASADFVDDGGTVTFAPGETVKQVHVTVIGDDLVEGDEYVNVAISRPVNGLLTGLDAQAPLVIVDSDAYGAVGAVTAPNGTGVSRVAVRVTGNNRAALSTTTAADGSFSFADLPDGRYRFTPSATGKVFSPASYTVDVQGGTVGGMTFIALTNPSISGRVVDAAGDPVPGVAVTRKGNGQADATAVTNGAGYYGFSSNPAGTYTIRPTLRGATFRPAQTTVTQTATNAVTANFTQNAAA